MIMNICKTPGCTSTAINDDPLKKWCDVCNQKETVKDLRTEIQKLQVKIDNISIHVLTIANVLKTHGDVGVALANSLKDALNGEP